MSCPFVFERNLFVPLWKEFICKPVCVLVSFFQPMFLCVFRSLFFNLCGCVHFDTHVIVCFDLNPCGCVCFDIFFQPMWLCVFWSLFPAHVVVCVLSSLFFNPCGCVCRLCGSPGQLVGLCGLWSGQPPQLPSGCGAGLPWRSATGVPALFPWWGPASRHVHWCHCWCGEV